MRSARTCWARHCGVIHIAPDLGAEESEARGAGSLDRGRVRGCAGARRGGQSMLPWWPVAEDSQVVNSMEVFTWLLTLSESWPPLADCTVNERT